MQKAANSLQHVLQSMVLPYTHSQITTITRPSYSRSSWKFFQLVQDSLQTDCMLVHAYYRTQDWSPERILKL